MNESQSPLLEMRHISKEFFGNQVLTDINFTLQKGEILGLVGENGAGKTTLMKILFGMDIIHKTGGFGGEIFIEGKPVTFASPFEALDAGIGMVHQEFSLLPDFTATENILLNRESVQYNALTEIFGDRLKTLDRNHMANKAEKAIKKLGIELSPDMLVSEMPVGHRQFTEIARELSKDDVKLLVLDEPTAVLTEKEAEILLTAVKRLSEEGIAIIFISHRLQEILDVTDKLLILRDGAIVQNIQTKNTTIPKISEWMVGREVDESKRPKNDTRIFGDTILSVENLWVDMPGETVRDVNIEVKQGEIFGIGGLAGQGKLGIPNGIMGLFHSGGKVVFNGQPVDLHNPLTTLASGIAFVSEDRRGVGLLLDESLDWNVSFTAMQVQKKFLKRYLKGLFTWRDERSIEKLTTSYIDKLQIKCTGHRQKARELSGGNQQKICLAKAFALDPKLLFVSEPTRGIDIGAKSIVLDTLRETNREKGTTIVMISSELEELRSVCDRIAIIDGGRISGILPATAPSIEFGLLMIGKTPETSGVNE